MSPAPSPGNSENDLSKIDSNTMRRTLKSRKKSKKESKDRYSASTDEKSGTSPLPPSLDQTPDDAKPEKGSRNSGSCQLVHDFKET